MSTFPPPSSSDSLSQTDSLPHGNRGPAIIASAVICTVFTACLVALRLWKCISTRRFRWDDGLIILATLLFIAAHGVLLAAVCFGEGRNVWDVAPQHRHDAFRFTILTVAMTQLVLVFAKASVCITLVQIKLGIICDSIIILATLVFAVTNLLVVIQVLGACDNRHFFPSTIASVCLPGSMLRWLTILRCAINIFADVLLAATPIFFLRNVHLDPRDRRVTNILLGFLMATVVFAIAKAVLTPTALHNMQNMTWYSSPMLCLDSGENALSIMTACLPAVRHVIKDCLPDKRRFWSGSLNSRRRSSTQSLLNSSGSSGRSGTRNTILPTYSSDIKSDNSSLIKSPPLALPSVASWSDNDIPIRAFESNGMRRISNGSESGPRRPSPVVLPTSRSVCDYRLSEPFATSPHSLQDSTDAVPTLPPLTTVGPFSEKDKQEVLSPISPLDDDLVVDGKVSLDIDWFEAFPVPPRSPGFVPSQKILDSYR
ncbi:hypothetical protein K461DRAFT_44336 [Myriangium duriaei CBS 260.36]|uniref:Rhodopsin domain-containing protein n=1 Tax=Myriangium duriaei CBS 260.36 TaxID=1168546 RepID=A0A9P4MCY8_9PEZI|nr:hypothetical protein K461DRAFT_44336 [Myriangium duriaei CBS 260.36]